MTRFAALPFTRIEAEYCWELLHKQDEVERDSDDDSGESPKKKAKKAGGKPAGKAKGKKKKATSDDDMDDDVRSLDCRACAGD